MWSDSVHLARVVLAYNAAAAACAGVPGVSILWNRPGPTAGATASRDQCPPIWNNAGGD